MSYLINHWRGKLSISVSLWVNMIGLLVLISVAEYFVLSRLLSHPGSLIRNTLLSLFITRVIIYPWQLIGLFRSIEHDFIEHKNSLKTRVLQAFALLTILFTLVYSLEVVQGAVFYTRQLENYAKPSDQVAYQIRVDEQQQQLIIKGSLDIGISNAAQSTLEAHPQIKSVSLQSGGGHLYEGRGLARLFARFGLDTYVYEECSSACTTAYTGGKQRYLGAQGKLGFHQYKLDESRHRKMVPFYNTQAEQQRDIELFLSRGIKPSFLAQIFNQPASRIWFPDHQALLDAQIVHSIVPQ